MPVAKEDFACAACTKRHETGNPAAALECRALPPIQGLARDAGFPVVRPDHYCHANFELDAEAAKARRAAAKETARLDGLVDATAATEAERVAAVAIPAGQPELALEPAAETAPAARAPRARSAKAAK